MADPVNRILCKAHAKLNLLLKVLGKRPDGYHEIYSLMQAIDLCDEISFTRTSEEQVTIHCKDPAIPTGDDNLISRAFRLMKENCRFTGGIEVSLRKKIPPGSGLGGGSSDCAAAIRAINVLFGLSQSRQEMSGIGARIGSDVPFFFGTGSAVVRGRGEIVEDVDLPLDYSVLIVVPSISISTGEVYRRLRIRLTKEGMASRFELNREKSTSADLQALMHNDLTESVIRCCPEVRKAGEKLVARGFEHVSMSGSGSAVFALVPDQRAIDREWVNDGEWGNWRIFRARPIRLPWV